MRNFNIKKVLHFLGTVLRCPVCNQAYNLSHTKILNKETNDFLSEIRLVIHSDCQKCKSSVIFNVEVSGPEIFSVGVLTDLSREDSAKFRKSSPIGANEILNIHQSLQTFDGDFSKSINQPPKNS